MGKEINLSMEKKHVQEFQQKLQTTQTTLPSSILPQKKSPKRTFLEWIITSRIALETIRNYAQDTQTEQHELLTKLEPIISDYSEFEKYIMDKLDMEAFQDLVKDLFALIKQQMNTID
jgi:hypothetical protein